MANRQPTAFRTDSGAKGVSLPVLTTGAEFQNDQSHGASHTAMGEAAVVEAGLADAAAMTGNDSMN
jgi:hypothetical protein